MILNKDFNIERVDSIVLLVNYVTYIKTDISLILCYYIKGAFGSSEYFKQ
jgi:hypothetical protein